ncbi:MAG: lysophospholipid acyltransferase family protein [Alphaproteobacteria bacterium]
MTTAHNYGTPYGATWRGMIKLTLLAGWIGLTFVWQPWIVLFTRRLFFRTARFVHHTVCRILRIDIVQIGTPCTEAPVLFVANHTSYLDIPVLGSIALGSFVAKSEVAGWPVIGPLCKLQRTIFIQRKTTEAGNHRNVLRDRLENGQNLILFAEGTSTDGCHILPFKSSLFSVAEQPLKDGMPIYVQPVSITAIALDGLPMGRTLRPLYAWYGNMTLAAHGWPMLRLGRMKVAVEFHPAVRSTDYKDRKALAGYCSQMALAGVNRALTGRDPNLKMLPAPQKERATPRPKQEA